MSKRIMVGADAFAHNSVVISQVITSIVLFAIPFLDSKLKLS
ncbi:hypothetical protein Q4574_02170 [Aliiglaciecola sp. 3_MG-2023]|nr:hypothetical protein [Aliiglaciecola sp. 3_MG-2023]MDO6692067.1 hypothetical protein [Aliiglaciecola sp. 3_MG-2023]